MSQQMFADAYAGDPDIYVPNVIMATGQVLVSDWMDGTPLSRIITQGSKEQRDNAGILLVRFLFSGPSRAGLLHADPHPGNFRAQRRAPGRARLRRGGPAAGRAAAVLRPAAADHARRRRGRRGGRARAARARVPAGRDPRRPGALHAFLAPLAQPSKVDSFKFSQEWLREEASRVTDMRTTNINPPVQRAAVLRPHPPGVHGGHRGAVPVRTPGRVPAPKVLEAGYPATPTRPRSHLAPWRAAGDRVRHGDHGS